MKTVFYYTSTYFLDVSLEMINILKTQVNLHVVIEITAQSKKANIVNVEKLPAGGYLFPLKDVLTAEDNERLQPFFEGTASAQFVVHPHATGLSFTTIGAMHAVKKFMKKHQPDIIHFEGFSLRTLSIFPYLLSVKKIIINVHDAVLHSGENSWKSRLPRYVFFNLPIKKTFLFYSAFTMQQFRQHVKYRKGHLQLLQMYPFSYFASLAKNAVSEPQHILFFGRISPYKGVNILLDAMPAVLEKYPDEQLVIAGSGASEMLLNHPILKSYKSNVKFFNRYIPNEELVELLTQSKFVVCPYIDATQSGVLMSAFALNKPAIASKVGAFQMQIVEGWNGLLVPPSDAAQLSAAIIKCIHEKFYSTLQKNIASTNRKNPWLGNLPVLTKEYETF